jgi:hypothetical protein
MQHNLFHTNFSRIPRLSEQTCPYYKDVSVLVEEDSKQLYNACMSWHMGLESGNGISIALDHLCSQLFG